MRVFLVVFDSLGAGALPDAHLYSDEGAHTLRSLYNTNKLNIPNLISLGLGNIEGLGFLGKTEKPLASYGRSKEASLGKDTTTGHWEIAGVISQKPFPTYPNGFDEKTLNLLSLKTGRKIICNLPYSGTEVIKDYGEEHLKTGALIVYTSADSVLQIAAHEEVVPLEDLYEYCRYARRISDVGRVIARPFSGEAGNFFRTSNRRDFSLKPPKDTLLDLISKKGKEVISVGKISDIFAGQGITKSIKTHSNNEGMKAASSLLEQEFDGLCFVNLVDFDMVYGHRNDADGYTNALNQADKWLGEFIKGMNKSDLLILTADHGCDPSDKSTDHTREYIPILAYGRGAVPLGTRQTFADIGATVAEALGLELSVGKSFLGEI